MKKSPGAGFIGDPVELIVYDVFPLSASFVRSRLDNFLPHQGQN
jgi:hypothetical protein